MRSTLFLPALAAALFFFSGSAPAQDAKTVKVDIKEAKVVVVPTPQFQAPNVPDKRWRPKGWLELDVGMMAKKAKSAADPSTMIDTLEVKVFIGLNKADASKKFIVLTGTLNVLNVPGHGVEHAHALAFVSPATLTRLLDSNTPFNASSDIKAIGVEVNYGGQPVGYYSQPASPYPQRWWSDLSKFSAVDGVLLPKTKTPFAPLWGDYDLEIKQ